MADRIEACAEAVHRAYCDSYLTRTGKPYWTGGDYSKLDDATKEIDRSTVRAVFTAVNLDRLLRVEKAAKQMLAACTAPGRARLDARMAMAEALHSQADQAEQ